MAEIRVQGPEPELEEPTLVEGFPGVGPQFSGRRLVGKIATDHLVEELEMRYYASLARG